MEIIPVKDSEHEPPKPDNIRTMIIEQEEVRMAEALTLIKTKEEEAHRSRNVIDSIEHDLSTPTIVFEVGFDEYDFDVYTYSSKEIDRGQYTVRSDSLNEAIDTLAKHLVEGGHINQNSRHPELRGVGLVVAPALYHGLDSISQEISQLFHQSLKKYGYSL